MQFTIGSDPEVTLVDVEGHPVSAESLIGGTKLEPRKTKHGTVQEDNILLEFNPKPANSKEGFIKNTADMLVDIQDIITPLDLNVAIRASSRFTYEEVATPQARLVGCEPDFNAWTFEMNEPPEFSPNSTLRTCGGHVHIGFNTEETGLSREELVQAMDLLCGVPSVLMDDDTSRRKIYGKAGAYRSKLADIHGFDGVEYRTLSNFWIGSEKLMGWVYDCVARAVNDGREFLVASPMQGTIQHTINNSDKDEARKLIKQFRLEVA